MGVIGAIPGVQSRCGLRRWASCIAGLRTGRWPSLHRRSQAVRHFVFSLHSLLVIGTGAVASRRCGACAWCAGAIRSRSLRQAASSFASGAEVKKEAGGVARMYVYEAWGQVAAEYGGRGGVSGTQ